MSVVREIEWLLAVVQSWWQPYDHGEGDAKRAGGRTVVVVVL